MYPARTCSDVSMWLKFMNKWIKQKVLCGFSGLAWSDSVQIVFLRTLGDVWSFQESLWIIRVQMAGRRLHQSYQDAICGAFVTAVCYIKSRPAPSPVCQQRLVTKATPVTHFQPVSYTSTTQVTASMTLCFCKGTACDFGGAVPKVKVKLGEDRISQTRWVVALFL